MDINLVNQDLIWSFNPSAVDSFAVHSPSNRGNLQSILSSGLMIQTSSASFETKQAHGFGMAAVWILLFPFGIAYARYFRSTSGWVFVHAIIQLTGIFAIVAFLFLAVSVSTDNARTHSVIGFVLVGSIVVQLLLGVSNALSLRFSKSLRSSDKIRFVHRYFGLAMVFLIYFLSNR
jgi:hypothetical protein